MSLRRFLPIPMSIACACLLAQTAAYDPANGWRFSTPEAQGLDSTALAAVVDNITRKHLNVHSVTVIRHGYVVLDSYFYPYQKSSTHDVASVTKSITAALVGIAVDKGLVRPDQKILSFFPDEAPPNPDALKQKITVADMLSMMPGLDCGFAPGEQELEQMRRTHEWVKFALALPMKYEPGTKYGYCSPGYHLLGSMIGAVAHEPEAQFAQQNLFGPLGIKDVVWPPDEQGRTHGWGDAHLYPLDMAKLGYLYLHDGVWGGKQIVSKEWVRKSITKQADTGRGGGFGYGWQLTRTDDIDEFGYSGRGGQRIAVWASKDMIVIVTGAGYPASEVLPPIAKSIRSDGPIAASADGVRQMRARVEEAAVVPSPSPVAELPAMAKTVSGATYEFPRNSSRIDAITLRFDGRTEAQLTVKYLGTDLKFPVGLDGVYRLGPYGPLGLLGGATGHWTSDTDFALDLNFIANINRYSITLHFGDDAVQMDVNEASGLIRNGHVAGKKL